ncbi:MULTISPECIES: DUF4127 family protein [Bacillaceae]|uniref:DUF4127 family protein n=1 Tax=Bacillaceae TaxID=186817 RepID=UPI002963D169|nr:DUF4127 family protein [Bacillus infantis]MDW2876484.1 DUF4127 family protein [Bacillus infantis]
MKKTLFLVLMLLLIVSPFFEQKGSAATTSEPGSYLSTVAYVPIDDRPVNLDRVIAAGKALGIRVLTPPKDIISTKLDYQGSNQTGKRFGDPAAILNWLRSVESQVDGFIVSADMIASGGLVGSRLLNQSIPYSTAESYLNQLASLKTNGKPMYIFDSVMRLAPTVGVEGIDQTEYDAIRKWASQPRKVFTDQASIIENYHVAPDGTTIQSSNVKFQVSPGNASKFYAARERKFKLNRRILDLAYYNESFDYVAYGVDDSNKTSTSSTTIQENEVNWITKIARDRLPGISGVTSDTDGLGMTMLGRFANVEVFDRTPKVRIAYYGSGYNEVPSSFDFHALNSMIKSHVSMIGGTAVASGQDMDLLVRTQDSTLTDVRNLSKKSNDNFKSNMPTAVIDAGKNSTSQTQLSDQLILEGSAAGLMAYSSWNTTGNTVGLAVGYGPARTMHVKSVSSAYAQASKNSHAAYHYYTFVKDTLYQNKNIDNVKEVMANNTGHRDANANLSKYISASSQAYQNIRQQSTQLLVPGLSNLQRNFTESSIIVSMNGTTLKSRIISIQDPSNWPSGKAGRDGMIDFPWKRSFEAEIYVDAQVQ